MASHNEMLEQILCQCLDYCEKSDPYSNIPDGLCRESALHHSLSEDSNIIGVKKMDVTVSESMAKFFMEQCMGETAGHMAMIPNNPTLYGLTKAHMVNDKNDFARFLRQIADQLIKDQPF